MPRHRGPDWLSDPLVNGEKSKVPERIDMILELVREQREGQAKTNALLGDLRSDMAGVKTALEGQQASTALLQGQVNTLFDRQRQIEQQAQQIPQIERELNAAAVRYDGIEKRVRTLETDASRAGVVTGAVSSSAKELLKWVLSIAAGAIAFVAGWFVSR